MRHRYMLWTGHLGVLLLLAGGLHWLLGEMPGMKDYKMMAALVAMTCLVFNHFRWWGLSKRIEEEDILGKIDLVVMVNYCIFALILALANFRR